MAPSTKIPFCKLNLKNVLNPCIGPSDSVSFVETMAGVQIISSVLCLVFIILGSFSSKINVPRVLLPIFNDFNMKFLLEANDGGCYKWYVHVYLFT